VLTSPREKRIGIQPAWERGGNPLGASPADEQEIFLKLGLTTLYFCSKVVL
jgi:hypothetical protein